MVATAGERDGDTRRTGSPSRAARLALVALAAAASLAGPARAQGPGAGQQTYPVSAFELEYALPHPAHPPLAELYALELEMRVTRGGALMEPHPTTPSVRFELGHVPPHTRMWSSGLRYVNRRILEFFEDRGIGGVIVTLPDLEEGSGRDLRAPGETALRVVIWTGRVENVATVADGDRFPGTPQERTNRPEHRFVREGSPVTAGGEHGLLRIREIEEYAARLSRQPGRRVDAKLRPGRDPGTTILEYHVAEHRPWLAYASLANNGTEATGELRERFGASDTQLTGNDDVLRLDYVTGDFDTVHAFFGSYEGPVWRLPRLRWRTAGSYSEYDASELGVSSAGFQGQGLDFQGDQWEAGGRLTANVFQRGAFFLDVFGGARWRHVAIDNRFLFGGSSLPSAGQEEFLLPEAGLGISYESLPARLSLEASWERNLQGVARTHSASLASLGREEADPDFQLLQWSGSLSVYLEALINGGLGWSDPEALKSAGLAHELVLTTRGQWSAGTRLVPQFEQVAGGLYTVRGYDQSEVAGDSALIGSAEYRLHLARLLDPGGEPVEVPIVGPVQLRPTHVFARPDWDLVLRLFLDGARTYVSDRHSGEHHEALASYGVGVELQLLRYLRAGVDVAWPRASLSDGTQAGDHPRVHFLVSVMF